MKKRIFSLMLLLTLVFSLTACAGEKQEIRLDAIGKNEALIEKAEPCSTAEEVRNAGIPLSEEPFSVETNEEKGLESVTYLIQDQDFHFDLAGQEINTGFFQFVNDKLSNISMNLPDAAAYEAVKEEMTELYGEPESEDADGAVINIWEFQADYPVRAAVIGQLRDGEIVSGSFQVSYVFWIGGSGTAEKADKNAVFPLEGLQTEDGEFQYKDIPFGSSYEDVIQKMPIEFETMEVVDSSAVSCYAKETFDFYGCDAQLFMEFTEAKQLDTVKIQFELKEGEEQLQKIVADLTGLYGEPEIGGSEGDIFTSEIYSWGKGSTRLQAVLTKTESMASAVIGVFKIS